MALRSRFGGLAIPKTTHRIEAASMALLPKGRQGREGLSRWVAKASTIGTPQSLSTAAGRDVLRRTSKFGIGRDLALASPRARKRAAVLFNESPILIQLAQKTARGSPNRA